MKRDFTYVYDLVKAVYLLIKKVPAKVDERKIRIKNDSISNVAPYRIVNIGNSNPINLLYYIEEIEKIIGKVSKKNFLGMQDGDIKETHSNVELLQNLTGFSPNTSLHEVY